MFFSKKMHKDIDEITGEVVEAKVFQFLLPFLKQHIFVLSLACAVMGISVSITLYTPRLLGKIVDKALVPRDMNLLYQLCAIYLGLEFLKLLTKLSENFLLQRVGQNVMQDLRCSLFSKLIRMPVPFYDHNPTGRLITRVTNDTTNLMEIFGPGFVTLLADIFIVIGVMISILTLDFRLGLIAISIFPFMAWAMNYFSMKLRVAYREARYSLSALNAFFAERVSGMPTIQTMGMEEYERKRFQKLSQDYFQKQMGSVYVFAYFHPVITILSAISIALVLYFGGFFVDTKVLPLGIFVSFLSYVQVLFQPIRGLTEKYNIYQNAMSSAERIFSILKLEKESGLEMKQNLNSEKDISKIEGNIEFKKVSFSYDTRNIDPQAKKWALLNASFEIKAKQKIALIGHTGAGKSTLFSLLFRFYSAQEGSILIDGKLLETFPKEFLRRRFGFVQQDVFIFAGTIRENLKLLGENITEEKIQIACEATGFNKIISRLERGLDTVLDERGSNLSLGERQVLAITRVLLQEPDILFLDEATSHVDSESEMILQHAMDEVTKNRTSLVIAHRLSTISNADKIFVFEQGKIIESGSPSDLKANKGAYFHFLASQI